MTQIYNRRTILKGSAVGTAALLAGCLGDTDPGEETYYVVVYHWGFAAFDEEGTEHDLIEVSEGTELTLVAVNDHASDAFDELPAPVETVLEEFDALARTKQLVEDGIIPEPEDATIEEVYQATHDHAHDNDDHHDDDPHDDNDHHNAELTMMDHELIIPGFDVHLQVLSTAHEPVQTSFVTDEPGTFEFVCTHDCGYGHPYMRREMLRVS